MNVELLSKISSKVGSPVFIYDAERLKQNIERIKDAIKLAGLEKRIDVYLAYFCNSNPHLFKYVTECGVGAVLQSEEEYYQLKHLGINITKITSPSFLSNKEIDWWTLNNIDINLSSLEEVSYFISRYPDKKLGFRLDISNDDSQRNAIKKYQIPELKRLLLKSNKTPHTIHIYTGTGSSLSKMVISLKKILSIYKNDFPQVNTINLGGGFSFNYNHKDQESGHFEWNNYFKALKSYLEKMKIPEEVKFIIEPGRDVFADSGAFLLSVKRIVERKEYKNISTDGSYVFMPSATIRTRQHNLKFFNNKWKILSNSSQVGFICGSTTLSSDYIFPGKIHFPKDLKEGDYILINDTGAYCSTQHMEFLNKRPCPEVVIEDNSPYLISRKGDFLDKIRNLENNPALIE